MRTSTKRILSLAGGVTFAFLGIANAQNLTFPGVGGDPKHALTPPGDPPPTPGPLGVVKASSWALGIQRLVNPGGPNNAPARAHGVNGIMFTASGTMSEPKAGGQWTDCKVSKVVTEMTYYTFSQGVAKSPGTRWDFTCDASGKPERKIFVAAGDAAWNEQTPGGSATAAMDMLSDRLTHIWLSPHGLIWAAINDKGDALAKGVTVSQEGGKDVFNIPINGVMAKVTLDADKRPAKVETKIKHPVLGEVPVEITYSDYRDFERAYWVYFPERIVEKINGKTVLDLKVSEFHANPYSVFPVPSNVMRASK